METQVTDTETDLELAVRAAKSAGEILLKFWAERSQLTVSNKRVGDFVSEADLTSENHLKELLLGACEADQWLGEETGAEGKSSRRWIVDPLDGTTNFLRGIPFWSVSVALEIDGELTVGVVHDAVHSETFAAQLGHGATLNGLPIEVSNTEAMASALFGTGVPFGSMAHIADSAADIRRLMPHCAGVRRMGSAALDLAYVASGRLDGFWERKLQIWDIAAGLVLLREAGATLEGAEVSEKPEQSGTVMTATPKLFSSLTSLLRASN
jgi:myo-inositol-1(or 4)-monophosphatase